MVLSPQPFPALRGWFGLAGKPGSWPKLLLVSRCAFGRWRVSVCLYIYVYVCMQCIYARVYVRLYVRMYVRMYICRCICVCVIVILGSQQGQMPSRFGAGMPLKGAWEGATGGSSCCF